MQALNLTPRHINGSNVQQVGVHLVIADQPHGTYVENAEGFEHRLEKKRPPPIWNRYSVGTKPSDWYNTLFSFIDEYLDDDGGLEVLMPFRLTYELNKWATKKGYTIAGEWICHLPEPLAHVLFENMKVRFSLCTLNAV